MLVTFFRPTGDAAEDPDRGGGLSLRHLRGGVPPRQRGARSGRGRAASLRPRPGEALLRTEDLEALLAERGPRSRWCCFPGCSTTPGSCSTSRASPTAAHRAGLRRRVRPGPRGGQRRRSGCTTGTWTSRSGAATNTSTAVRAPSAGASCTSATDDSALPRFAGWWGNDPATRFRMHLNAASSRGGRRRLAAQQPADPCRWRRCRAVARAVRRGGHARAAGQVGAAHRLSGVPASAVCRAGRRASSRRDDPARARLPAVAPHADGPRSCSTRFGRAGVVGDFRAPDVIRVAPVPLVQHLSRGVAVRAGASSGDRARRQ